jgi:hypothetical protein
MMPDRMLSIDNYAEIWQWSIENPSSHEASPIALECYCSRAAEYALLMAIVMDGKRQSSLFRKAISSHWESTTVTAALYSSLSSSI